MAGEQGPEPTLWELMRGINRIDENVAYLRENTVTRETFRDHVIAESAALDRLGNEVAEERRERGVADERAKTERLAAIEAEAAIRHQADLDEKTARKEDIRRLEDAYSRIGGWVKWGGGILSSVLIATIGWILSRGGA